MLIHNSMSLDSRNNAFGYVGWSSLESGKVCKISSHHTSFQISTSAPVGFLQGALQFDANITLLTEHPTCKNACHFTFHGRHLEENLTAESLFQDFNSTTWMIPLGDELEFEIQVDCSDKNCNPSSHPNSFMSILSLTLQLTCSQDPKQ